MRKVKRAKDRPGEGIQILIKKFLQKVEKEEGDNKKAAMGYKTLSPEKSKRPLKPTSKGAGTKRGLASKSSRPTPRPSLREGGKISGGGLKTRTGSMGALERWLLPLGKMSGPSGLQVMDKDSKEKGIMISQGGQGPEGR